MKIELGIYTIIFCLPLYLVRLNIFGIPSTALELGIYILFVIWLIKNYKNINWREIIPDKMLKIGIILLMAGAVTSTILSTDLRVSAGILKGWFFDPFLFFIIITSEIKNNKQAINLLKVFSFSGFVVAVASLLYWFGFLPNGVSYDGRLHSFYSSPNYLAMYLAVPFIVAVWVLFLSLRGAERRSNLADGAIDKGLLHPSADGFAMTVNKYFWLIVVLITAIPIYLTYSYAAWFAIFFAIILLFYFAFGAEKKLSFQRKLSFLSIFLILIVLFFSQAGTDKFENLKNLAYRSSANSRIMIWRAAFMIGRDNPVLGIGPGNFQRYYLDYQKKFSEPYLEWAVPQPHNIFLAFWLQTGILGLAGFILILIWFFRSPIQNFKLYFKIKIPSSLPLQREGARPTPNPSQEGNKFPPLKRGNKGDLNAKELNLSIVLTVIMAYILLHGLFDTTYWKNDLAMIFWLILGLAIRLK